MADGTTRFWVGASTLGALGSAATGVRSLDVDTEGRAVLGDPVEVGENPMFLAISPANGVLAIAHELTDGRVSTWTLEGDGLAAFGRAGSASGDPCHVAFDESGELAFAANYSGGRLTVHHIAPDASGDAALEAEFAGTGPDRARQESSHPHQAVLDSARDRLLVPDLGADRVRVVGLAALPESLGHDPAADIVIHAGAGPRHLVVSGDLAVTANELDRTASVVDLAEGRELGWFPIGPETPPRGLGCSAIRLTRGGIVLVGDRDADALRGLRLDRDAAMLELVATVPTGGRHPRDLELTRDERFALIADQGSDSIAIVALDGEGVPVEVVGTVSTPAPACLARVP